MTTGGAVDQLYIEITARMDGFERSLRELEREAGRTGEQAGSRLTGAFKGALGGIGAAAAGAAAAVGGALAAGGVAALGFARQAQEGLLNIQSQLGVTAKEAKELGETAKNVFANNWGESLADAQNMVIEVRKQMRGLTNEELDAATQAAAALADTFGTEVGEQAQAANTLMQDFGLTSQEAFDFLAKGFQEGLNNSGDFLETITEYSTQFKNGGASAAEFYSIMASGQQGGMLGVDRAADAFKEFVVRIQDGSKTTSAGLDSIGINAEKMAAQLGNGTISAADAFQTVIKALNETDDANVRMQAGVALIGTQFEDLGMDAALALDMAGTKMEDMAGAAESLGARYETLGAAVQGVWRQVLVELEPVGAEMLSMINDALPSIKEAIQTVVPMVGEMVSGVLNGADQIRNGIDQIREVFAALRDSDAAEAFKSNFAILKSAAAEVFGAVSSLVQNVFIPSIQAMAPVAQGMWAGLRPVFSAIAPLVKSVAGVVSAAVNLIVLAFQHIAPVVRPLLPIIGGAFNGMGHVIAIAVRAITTTLNALAALLRGDLPAAARIMQNLISKAIHSAADVFRVFGSLATRALSGVAARMGTVGRQIVQGLINGIKAGIGGVIATMRRLASSAVNAAKNALVIRSPSRVMFGVGQYTAEGFVKGIDDKKPAVARAARNSAKLYVNETLKELAEGRKRIREAIKDAQLASDIKNATDKQLASALKRAYDAGDFEKWNAVLLEQKRRAEAVKTALERVAEAQQNIREGEAFDAWKESLEGYSDAQLEAAKAAEFAAGETQRYNAVIAEQKRRAEEAAEALEKLRSVQQDMRAEVLSEAKGVILNDLLDFDALKDIREQAYKSGDKALWKAAREAMQENGREAARGYIDSMEAVLSSGGSYPEAWATLQKGLNDLRGQRAQGFDVSEGISMLYQQVEKLQAGLRELDPALRRAVRSGEVLFQADKPADQILGQKLEIPLKNRWDEFLKKLANDRALKDYEKRLRAEFSNADLAAELDRIAASSLNAEEKIERYNVVLDVQADRAKQAEEAAKVLVAMQREVSAAVADSERPFAKQLQQLEELRLAVSDSETLRQIDGLIAAYRKMQAEAEQRDALKAKINKWSGYAQQLVPLVSAAFEAIGGMSQEAAAQWGQALDSMVSDLTNFGMALAKGDYFAAAVQGLTTIFGWFNRNKRAAAEAAKAAADYNAQFRFSQNGYGTRSVSSYSTGILFWKTTHYTESIDEAKKQLALNLESGFIDGIREGFKTALEQNDFGAFQQKLKESVGEAVINGLIDAFMKKAVLGDIIGPAIQGYLDTGNAGLLETAIQGATAISEQLFHDLRGIRERLGLGSANAAGGLNQMGDLFGNAPSIQLGIPRIEVAMPPILTESLNAFGASVPVFDRASHRMLEAAELILSTRNAGGPPPLSRRGPLV